MTAQGRRVVHDGTSGAGINECAMLAPFRGKHAKLETTSPSQNRVVSMNSKLDELADERGLGPLPWKRAWFGACLRKARLPVAARPDHQVVGPPIRDIRPD
jgi:hypothetical protein